MIKKPLLNALAATLYIFLIVFVMTYGSRLANHNNSMIVPIAVLSLFTLSAAVMGYLFLAQPLQLYLDGEKKQAITFFLQTVAIFAGITVVLFALLFSGIFGYG